MAARKERSRSIAAKHRLSGEGVALPTEDPAVISRRFRGLRDELAPQTVLGGVLVKRIALLSVRLDRSARREAAAVAERVEHAGEDFDEARMAEVERLVAGLDDDPAGSVRKLRRMVEGVDRMISGWTALREDVGGIGENRWFPIHCEMAEKLTGHRPEGIGTSRIEALFRASGGDFRYVGEEAADRDDQGRRDWATALLAELCDDQLARLRAHRATLDAPAIARDRAGAADRALFDGSKDAVLARKFEAAAERGLYRALKELRAVEQDATAVDEDEDAVDEEEPGTPPMGSFEPAPADDPAPPAIGPEATRTGRSPGG